MIEFFIAKYNYWIVIGLMMIGFYAVISRHNLVKKIIGINIFQTSVFLFYISLAKVDGGTAPVYLHDAHNVIYDNPLPHVLILTAIVVSVATTAVALGLIIRINKAYGTIEDDQIRDIHAKNMIDGEREE